MEVDHLQLGQHVGLDELPEGDDDAEVGAAVEHVVDAVDDGQPSSTRPPPSPGSG